MPVYGTYRVGSIVPHTIVPHTIVLFSLLVLSSLAFCLVSFWSISMDLKHDEHCAFCFVLLIGHSFLF